MDMWSRQIQSGSLNYTVLEHQMIDQMGKSDFKNNYTIRFCTRNCTKEYEAHPLHSNFGSLDFYSNTPVFTYSQAIQMWFKEHLLMLIALFGIWLTCYLKIKQYKRNSKYKVLAQKIYEEVITELKGV
jgi:hypothetical protein